MADFYIVPPRLIVGSFDRTNAVTSLNSLKGDLTLLADTNSGLRVSVAGGNFRFSVEPNFYVKITGSTVTGNLLFTPSGSNFGVAVGSGSANPGSGTTGGLFFNTTDGTLKVYDGTSWGDIISTGGITQANADLRYLKLDGTNTPTASLSMGSQFLRLANLATQASPGLSGQIFYNQDIEKISVYTPSGWMVVGTAITAYAGVGISVKLSSFGSTISVDESYNFTWTGAHVHTQPITFAASQSFDINKLDITGQAAGDLIYYDGSNWNRLPIGDPNQGLKVLPSGTGITWGTVSASGGGSGVSHLNNLTEGFQFFDVGTSGNLFNISSIGQTHTFNIPIAGVGKTGLVSPQAQTFEGIKTFNSNTIFAATTGSATTGSGSVVIYGGLGISENLNVGGSAVIVGDLTVHGTTTTVNSTIVTIDDKNIELAATNTPSDAYAEGGGITLKGTTDKFINWYAGVGWSSSESWNLGSGQTFKIDNTTVLSATSLGTGVTNSSLTALGTITTGVWAGTAITPKYGGTGFESYTKGDLLVGAGSTLIIQPVGSNSYVLSADSASASGVTWIQASSVGSSVIGTPTDGVYSDGFFNTWTNQTTVANAMDDINELLALIAPSRPNYLTGTTLTASSVPTYYTVRISAGLGTEWYQAGYGTGSSISRYYLTGTFTLNTANTSTTFSAGSLTTSTYGVITFKTYNKNFPTGAGYGTIDLTSTYTVGTTNNNLKLTALDVYNNIWTKANAQILTYTQAISGYEGMQISHTENSQATNIYEAFKDAWSASNGSPSFATSATASTYSQSLKYLSGIGYFTSGTGFSVYFKSNAGIYSSCYNSTQIFAVSATGLATSSWNPTTPPAYNDVVDRTGTGNEYRVVLNSASASSFNQYLTVTLYKAHNTTATSNATISRYINTYTSLSTFTNEQFQDEDFRRVIDTDNLWTSTTKITNGNAQVRSGTLRYPVAADYDSEYPGAAPHSFSGDQEYQRYFYKTSASTGTLTLSGVSGNAISAYGSGSLNMLLYLEGDALYYDLGTLQGSNSNNGSSRSVPISAKTSSDATTLNWSIGTKSTGVSGTGNSARYRLIVIYKNSNPQITRIQSS